MNSNDSIALQISGFSYDYRSHWTGKPMRAVEDLSLSVHAGESFGFLGHNGAGKTTTIKSILGLSRPSSGTIEIFGQPHSDPEARQLVGYLPEQPYFYDHLSVKELVEMYARLAGVPSGEVSGAAMRALERTKVAGRARSPLRSLSKGLTQRVAMAQAIVHEPKLLILDEPFSGLDPIGRKEFKDLLFDLKESGTTIFASSHILEDIEFLCDRASIMSNGKLKLVLDLKELDQHVQRHYELTLEQPVPSSLNLSSLARLTDEQGSSVYYTFDSRESAEEALQQALAADASVSLYRAAHGSLEELFVQLVQFDEAQQK